jgi:hypothetical protein
MGAPTYGGATTGVTVNATTPEGIPEIVIVVAVVLNGEPGIVGETVMVYDRGVTPVGAVHVRVAVPASADTARSSTATTSAMSYTVAVSSDDGGLSPCALLATA